MLEFLARITYSVHFSLGVLHVHRQGAAVDTSRDSVILTLCSGLSCNM